MQKGEDLVFKYSGLFQNVEVRIFNASKGSDREVAVDADIKLPILKKQFVTATKYKGDSWDWEEHFPIREADGNVWSVKKSAEHGEALDPITFFMELHLGDYDGDAVKLLLGKKVVELDVAKVKNGYQIKRRDKDQSLIVRKDARGIAALELPVPVLGSLSIKRAN